MAVKFRCNPVWISMLGQLEIDLPFLVQSVEPTVLHDASLPEIPIVNALMVEHFISALRVPLLVAVYGIRDVWIELAFIEP